MFVVVIELYECILGFIFVVICIGVCNVVFNFRCSFDRNDRFGWNLVKIII